MQQSVPNPMEAAETQDQLEGRFPWPEPTDPLIIVEHRVAEGDAAEEIVHLAQAVPCDLIVMGTHGRTGWNRFLTGSVAEEVVRRATCPVLTIKHAPAGAASQSAPVRHLAKPGEIVDARPLGEGLLSTPSRKLLASHGIEVTRLILPAGKDVFEYRGRGTFTVHCLEGRVAITALGKTIDLKAGQLLYLPRQEPHTFKALEDSDLLLTIALPEH
jgi:quercetin dioxygenase-like cupin family protein